MIRGYSYTCAGSVARSLKVNHSSKPWHLRYKKVCASTEIDLSRLIDQVPYIKRNYCAVFASRQNFGKGQYGRKWESSLGGIWLSASLPFDDLVKSSGFFGLAVAVALAKTLQQCSVPVKLKWPNDLIVHQKKLVGFLPRIVSRGKLIKYARVGIGLNVNNRVPEKAISLAQIFSQSNLSLSQWISKVLISLEDSENLLGDHKLLRFEAESILSTKEVYDKQSGKLWKINGIDDNGYLVIKRGFKSKLLNHWD